VVSGADAFFIAWGHAAPDDGFAAGRPASDAPRCAGDGMSRLADAAAAPLVVLGAAALTGGKKNRKANRTGEGESGRRPSSAAKQE
jgi:hypothetical protein